MTPKVTDFLSLLEEVAPVRLAEPWDNPGLQVGSHGARFRKVCLALDPTMRSLQFASGRQAQLLLTHHPLIFEPLSCLDMDIHPGNVVVEALKCGISVVSAHTNLDAAKKGINDILAGLLNLENVSVLKEIRDEEGAGLGRIGDLPVADSLSSVAQDIAEVLGAGPLRVLGRGETRVRRVAVVGGAGGSLISLSRSKGADLLLTGDLGHHHALEAVSLGMALIDGGHFQTEKVAFGVFSERLEGMMSVRGWDVSVEVYATESDPMGAGRSAPRPSAGE